LRAGEIVTCEPGIYLYGKYGCRIEDMVCVRENGNYNFTHSTKELIEII
jgi:Xaa-Pro aminopeptidase